MHNFFVVEKVGLIAQKQIEDHDHLHDAISALMSEAEVKTKNEVDALRKMYNNNIEKLIEECSFLENVFFFAAMIYCFGCIYFIKKKSIGSE